MSDNTTQFSSKDFENFCKIHSIVQLTSQSYLPKSSGLAGRFVDVFKRAIKKASGIETVNEELQKFLSIYCITPNVNAILEMAPAELLFARKIRYSIDRDQQKRKCLKEKIPMVNITTPANIYIYFKNDKFGKAMWEEETIDKRIGGKMLYLIKHPKWRIKRHLNQIKNI